MLRMSVIHSERSGVTARMRSPAISPSTIATLRTGLREASHRSTLSISTMPPISLRRDRSSVGTSPSGGRRKIRTIRGFPAKIMSRPPATANSEKTRRKIRRARYGGSGMTASSRFQRLYLRGQTLCSAVASSRISLAAPSPRRSYAPLRIFLPQLQKTLLKDLVPRRLRRGRGPLPALRQPECGAMLVCVQRHHVEEERLSTSRSREGDPPCIELRWQFSLSLSSPFSEHSSTPNSESRILR